MSRPGRTVLLAALLSSIGMAEARESTAQSVPRVTVDDVVLSADTVEIGDSFELRMSVSLAPGSVLFLPDSIVAPGFEPLGPATWTVDRDRDIVEVVYPLIAFQVGTVEVPEFEVYAAAREEGVAAGMAQQGALVGRFEDFIDGVQDVPSARLRTVPAQQLWVASVLHVEDVAVGLRPRPPADVAGASIHVWAVLLGTAGLAVLLWAGGGAVLTWRRERAAALAAVTARDEALRALEELWSSGAHADGRLQLFFTRTSDIVRRYVETLERAWGPAWTSTELMRDLQRSPDGGDTDRLSTEMNDAEFVKFGGRRPAADDAEEHWEAVHNWIESRPTTPRDS
ncbi:MAG: hypothetical protein AAF389_11075 [Gemmatimonadota bacterium]